MLLSKIIEVIYPQEILFFKKNKNIKYITANSKLIINNSIYIVDFNKNKKKEFFKEAIKNGAVAILTNKRIKNLKILQLIVKNLSLAVNIILHSLKIPYKYKKIVICIVSSILKTIE